MRTRSLPCTHHQKFNCGQTKRASEAKRAALQRPELPHLFPLCLFPAHVACPLSCTTPRDRRLRPKTSGEMKGPGRVTVAEGWLGSWQCIHPRTRCPPGQIFPKSGHKHCQSDTGKPSRCAYRHWQWGRGEDSLPGPHFGKRGDEKDEEQQLRAAQRQQWVRRGRRHRTGLRSSGTPGGEEECTAGQGKRP